MRRIANRMLEWLFPALREWRIEAELEDGGEDAVSDADKAWCAKRNARTTSDERRVTKCGVAK